MMYSRISLFSLVLPAESFPEDPEEVVIVGEND